MVSCMKRAISHLLGRKPRSKSMEPAGATFRIKQKHLAILNQAGIPVNPYSKTNPDVTKHICEQLYNGVFLENGTLKFWVDREKKKDCYALYARALNFTAGDDTSYWQWHADHDNGSKCEVAELLRVMWLEVHGRFNTLNLERNTKYQVSFIVKLRRGSDMKGLPLTVRLILPDGTHRENQRSVGEVEQWVKLVVGEFSTSVGSTDGEMDICLEELAPLWKGGLVVKCIEVRPLT